MRTKKLFAGALAGTLLAGSCLSSAAMAEEMTETAVSEDLQQDLSEEETTQEDEMKKPVNITDVLDVDGAKEAIVNGTASFGANLLQLLNAEETDAVFLSPYSIESALSILSHCSGTDSETRSQILKVLGLDGISREIELAYGQNALWEALTGTDETVEIADTVLVGDQMVLSDSMNSLESIFNQYHISLQQKELSSEQTMNEINQWCRDNTNDMIDGLLDTPLGADTALVILNAVYFLGEWQTHFLKDDTIAETFHGASGDTSVDMMHMNEGFLYAETDSYQMIKIPYTDGYEMTVYLARDGAETSIVQDIAKDAQTFLDLVNTTEFNYHPINLALPKFTLEYSTELNDVLKTLGITDAFDSSKSDFSALFSSGNPAVVVDSILHKTKLIVDEEGTEAAAITGIMARTTAAMPQEPVEFHVDRPFAFTITHTDSKTMLFCGSVNNLPAAETSDEAIAETATETAAE